MRHFQLTFLFAWYDVWIGLFWDRKKRRLFVFPFPCLGVCLDFGEPGLLGRNVFNWDTGEMRPAPRVQFKLNP